MSKRLYPSINKHDDKTETINSDGAYHSVENQEYCKENNIDLILGGIQGKASRYDLTLDENNELIVIDLQNSNAKSRYRGLAKHKIWANIRCLWVNFVRIVKFIGRSIPKCAQNVKNLLFLSRFLSKFVKIEFVMLNVEFFYPILPSKFRKPVLGQFWGF